MANAINLVQEAFANANTYAAGNIASAQSFAAALSNAVYTMPTLNMTWTPITAPSPVTAPERPEIDETEFVWDGTIAAQKPGELEVDAPTIVIDDFTDVAPTTDFGTAPVLNYGTAPTVPEIAEIEVPTAPTIAEVDTPEYLTLETPTFAGVNLHTDLLEPLETMPTLTLVAPTAYSYTPGAEYSSALMTSLKNILTQRLAGGTGLDPAVEGAIWDRARDRETSLAQANIDNVMRTSESLGFALPPGVVIDQLREAQRDYHTKVSTLSRDIAIKQAELEQANLEKTITATLDLEGKLVDESLRLETLAYESAKTLAENAISIYNAQVEKFKTVLDAYRVHQSSYDTIIKAELAQIEVYKAELQGEQTKADVNRTLVEQFKAQIEAGLSRVKVYEAQVGGAQALMQLESAKLAAVGEEIKAYVAVVNGETAKVEAYKAGVQAELGKVEVYRAKASAFQAKAGAQAEKARAELSYYQAQVQAYSAQWEGYRARVQGEAARFQALASKSSAILDSYKIDVMAMEAEASQNAELFRAQVTQYGAQQNYSLAVEKLNADVLQSNRAALLEAGKVGAQTFAQLAAASMNIIHASAGVNAGAQNSVSYSYTNTTSSGPTPETDAHSISG